MILNIYGVHFKSVDYPVTQQAYASAIIRLYDATFEDAFVYVGETTSTSYRKIITANLNFN